MYLKELIEILEKEDPEKVVPIGFTYPHSYRGDYFELAFEPAKNVTVGSMLKKARGAVGQRFEGWKGGEFTMSDWTPVWLAWSGTCYPGESLGPLLLGYMLGNPSFPEER